MKKEASKRFENILENIRIIKVQGAENVAKAGVKAFLLQSDKRSVKRILETRPTEPLMQNAIKFLQKSRNPEKDSRKFLKELKKSHYALVKKGSMLIKNNMNVYTHCHSSSVIDILKYAKRKRKKKFVVYTSEVEPLLQGRETAEDLAKAKINVVVVPDLAAEQSLRKCDLFLFGADAFTKTKVANKIGTSTLVKLARNYNIPRYSAGVSLKFTRKIEIKMRSPREVWNQRNKRIEVLNPPFDKTKIKLLTGIVSEFGVLPPKQFVDKAREKLTNLHHL